MEVLQQYNVSTVVSRLMSGEGHLSFSSLKAFAESPARFVEYKLAKPEPTDAMVLGKIVHCLILEPEEFDKRYVCLDDVDICNQIGGAKPRATNKYKEWKAVALAEAGDRELIDNNDFYLATKMANAVRDNRASAKILALCPEREKKIQWEFKNFQFLGFIDAKGEKAKVDIKMCVDASPRKFQRTIIEEKYYLQDAMYTYAEGEDVPFYNIAVDRSGGVSVHKIHQHLLEHGMTEYNMLLDRFNECILKDHWDRSHDFYSELFDGTFVCEKPGWLY
jgi:hypothetical protein